MCRGGRITFPLLSDGGALADLAIDRIGWRRRSDTEPTAIASGDNGRKIGAKRA